MGICCSCCKNSDEMNNDRKYNNDAGNVHDTSSSIRPQPNHGIATNIQEDNRSNTSENSSQDSIGSTVIYSETTQFGEERMRTLTLYEDRNFDIGDVDRMEAPYPHFVQQSENTEQITTRNAPKKS